MEQVKLFSGSAYTVEADYKQWMAELDGKIEVVGREFQHTETVTRHGGTVNEKRSEHFAIAVFYRPSDWSAKKTS